MLKTDKMAVYNNRQNAYYGTDIMAVLRGLSIKYIFKRRYIKEIEIR
jgi:hypothetical protein